MPLHIRDVPAALLGADAIDPFAAYLRLATVPPAVLLDGPPAGEPLARAAVVLFDPFDVLRVAAGSDGRRGREGGADPFRRLVSRLEQHGAVPHGAGDPRLGGLPGPCAAGWLAYDLGRHLERISATAALETGVPDLWFGCFNRGLVVDLASGRGALFVAEVDAGGRRGPAYVERAFAEAVHRLRAPPAPSAPLARAAPLVANFTRREYEAAVAAVRARIRAGDVYQVNLSQRFATRFAGDPRALYARLRGINPAPFGAFLDLGDRQVLCSSPERFLRKEGERVETRPIKGTRRRPRAAELERVAAELLAAEKDGAELAMIIDLERNDLGRVARIGSVDVAEASALRVLPTVLHREGVVRARLRPECGAAELLRAAFPGGSITGAPKIMAMEVIEELERTRRGIFTGSIGWIGFDGDLDLNIAIRTLVVEDGRAHFHAGGGVVLDSEPAAEYAETLDKGRALAEALGAALPGDAAG